MKASYRISRKIWFSLSILILGYFFSMVLGFILGQRTESRLLGVSEKRFPMAQKSEMALMTFDEQIHLYSDAVLVGDAALVEIANEMALEVKALLTQIAELDTEDERLRDELLNTIKELDDFGQKAGTVYTKLSKDYASAIADPAVARQVRQLASQTEMFQKRLKKYSEKFSDDLKKDLADVSRNSRHQRFLNLFVFAGVVVIAICLIAIIISRSIVAPLKKTLMLEKVVEQFADGIAVTDIDGKIQFANWAWAQMHGFTIKEILGQSLALFHTREQIENELPPFLEVVKIEGINTAEIGHCRKDGTVFPTLMTTSQMLDENGLFFCIATTARDISHQKSKEEELRLAKKEAEAANIAKSDFLANMSHEIRTPLNGVMGVLNLLLMTELNEEQSDLVKTGKSSADGLLTVISDILDFSKIEAGKLDMEILDFDLRSALEEVVELPALHAQGKGLEFAYIVAPEIPSLIKGDPGRLRQIILNLTSNAIKFTEKGEVFLRILLEEESIKDVVVRFEVKDTGIGIPADKQSRVFESFEQSDASTTRKYGGTGLGLSISKKLAELMDGQIGLISEVGKGSTFWFTARFEKQPETRSAELVLPMEIHTKRFLLVDDNKTNIDVLGGYLKSWGCVFDVAYSGEVALTLLNAVAKVNAPFDAVIIDMLMPGMDGADLGRRIKEDPLLKDIKLVVLTSLGLRGEASRMKDIGFSAYLTKPIRMSQLFNCLASLFQHTSGKDASENTALVTKHTLLEKERKKTRILVAEDNIVNQKLAVKMIEKFGFQVDVAANGQEALKALESFHYDLVLMDVQMPVMDGFEATRRIREPNSKVLDRAVPVVALTANAMKGDKERCLDAGMNDYISKPIQPQELFSAITKNRRD